MERVVVGSVSPLLKFCSIAYLRNFLIPNINNTAKRIPAKSASISR
jgi:hypothetical protein